MLQVSEVEKGNAGSFAVDLHVCRVKPHVYACFVGYYFATSESFCSKTFIWIDKV